MPSTSQRIATLLFTLIACGVTWGYAGENTPRVRTFAFEYKAELKHLPSGAKRLDFWLAVPHDDRWQQIKSLHIDSRYPYQIGTTANGNKILHLQVNEPKEPVSIKLTLEATRREHVHSLIGTVQRSSQNENTTQLAAYLKPDRLVPLDDQIRAWAQEVVNKANAHTDLEKARAVYNHVVSTVKYDKTGQGWGRGDIYYACEARRGNCTDFHAIFIGYCRSLGIPARFAIGFPLPADRGQGRIAGYHCWAEFYAKGAGWVPVDASEATKNPAKREYFFGAHDENRIEFTKDRDLVLLPKQAGEPLNYFIYPYAEIDGKPFGGTSYEVSYRDLGPAGPDKSKFSKLILRNNSQF